MSITLDDIPNTGKLSVKCGDCGWTLCNNTRHEDMRGML